VDFAEEFLRCCVAGTDAHKPLHVATVNNEHRQVLNRISKLAATQGLLSRPLRLAKFPVPGGRSTAKRSRKLAASLPTKGPGRKEEWGHVKQWLRVTLDSNPTAQPADLRRAYLTEFPKNRLPGKGTFRVYVAAARRTSKPALQGRN
jgi:hypothetical protein